MPKFVLPGKTKIVNGTILAPENAGLRIIFNLVAQDGKYEGNLDKLLNKRWANVRGDYRSWYASQFNFKLGQSTTTAVASDCWVVQALVKDKDGKVDVKSLNMAVNALRRQAREDGASVHISEFLCDEVPELREMAQTLLVEEGVNVYFYKEAEKK
jgi:hypothetical protein